MATELYKLPDQFSAGESITYRRQAYGFPANAGWTLTLHLTGASELRAVATADGPMHVIDLEPVDTVGLIPGIYRWAERVANAAGEVHEIGSGFVKIVADAAAAIGGNQQLWLERAIAALQAHIEGRLPDGMLSYQIAGRVVSKMTITEALSVLSVLEGRLARVINPRRVTRPILVSFPPLGFDR
jgi:hypothetical protein